MSDTSDTNGIYREGNNIIIKRQCADCGKEKLLVYFHKDKAQPLGRTYICKECRNTAKRLNYCKTVKPTKPKRTPIPTPMMCEEVFAKYYNNIHLKTAIKKESVRLAKHNIELQEDLQQIAWMHIGLCANKSDEYLWKIAKNAMYREYNKQRIKRFYRLSDDELMTSSEYEMWRTGIYNPEDVWGEELDKWI